MPVNDQRRTLCQLGGLVAVGSVLPACGDPVSQTTLQCTVAAQAVGMSLDQLKVNTAVKVMVTGAAVWLCRDGTGVYALDAGCTHLGCDVSLKRAATEATAGDLSGGFTCACHGASFDPNGGKPSPPAPSDLPHYLVCTTRSGTIVVDPTLIVEPSTRYRV